MITSGGFLLLVLLLLPLLGALAVARLEPSSAKMLAFGISLVELALTVAVWFMFSPASGSRFQLELSADWIPSFGTHFALGIDGFALVLIAMTAVLVPIVLAFSWTEKLPEGRNISGMFALILATEGLLMGVFAATDVFLFYVFFEVMLIPMYFLIGRFGSEGRQHAAAKFFVFSLAGGLVMLASVIGLFVVSGEQLGRGTFTWVDLQAMAASVPESTQIWLFLGFFVAFAVKAPLVPFHTWLPDSAAVAPVGVGVLLVGVLDKVGTFGFLRYCLPLFPAASRTLAPLVLTLAVVGLVYGGLLAIGQRDMKRFVSYTSIAHFGYIALGVFAFSSQSFSGSVLYMVNHGFSTGLLFIVVGLLIYRGSSTLVADYGGVSKAAPLLAGIFLVAALAGLALPGTNSFVSEFLVLLGSYPSQPVYTIIATAGIIIAAGYVLWVYQRTMQGPLRGSAVLGAESSGAVGAPLRGTPPAPRGGGPGTVMAPQVAATKGALFGDLDKREIAVVTPLVLLILVLGFFPGPVLDVITPTSVATMHDVGLPDPVGGLGK